jgi:hypothetical protein
MERISRFADKVVPGRAEKRRIARAYILTDSLASTWEDFGGPEGRDVDMEQVKELLEISAAHIITVATVSLDFARMSHKMSSLPGFGFLKPLIMTHPLLFRTAVNELNDVVKRAVMMKNLETLEGRLEASVYFANYRNTLTTDPGLSRESQRRVNACTAAIDLIGNIK